MSKLLIIVHKICDNLLENITTRSVTVACQQFNNTVRQGCTNFEKKSLVVTSEF